MSFLTPTGVLPLYRNIDALEKTLNVLGYVPILGTFTGTGGRGVLAAAEIVSGIALAVLYVISFANPLAPFYGQTAVLFLSHGFLNGFRANIEMHPMQSLIFCLPFDFFVGRMFTYPI